MSDYPAIDQALEAATHPVDHGSAPTVHDNSLAAEVESKGSKIREANVAKATSLLEKGERSTGTRERSTK